MSTMHENLVDVLILGAGWSSAFIIPLLTEKTLSYAATTRSGRNKTIEFTFDPTLDDTAPFEKLPWARNVVVTFPVLGAHAMRRLVGFYKHTHSSTLGPRWVQLGSTGVWKEGAGRIDRRTPIDPANERGIAEDELLRLAPGNAVVLNLAGLWGNDRIPKSWLPRIAPSKEKLGAKTSLHLIHGDDVAAAIVAALMLESGSGAELGPEFASRALCGHRWMVTDMRVYDWWDLALAWGNKEIVDWIVECMAQDGVCILPRERGALWRCLDSSEFWKTAGIHPKRRLL